MPGIPPICSVRGAILRTPPARTREYTAKAAIGDDANKILWKKSSIKVAFLKKKVSLFKEWGLDADTILKWANRWSSDADSKIPTFEFCSKEKNADIIVELNENGRNESKIGRVDSAGGKPTMWLDLSRDNLEYHEHLVVHEFGHALGLEHEHQRSDFWKKIGPYIDISLMKADLPGRYEDYEQNFDPKASTDYDPESVMHYWFRHQWLIEDYNSHDKIEQQRLLYAISKSEKKALLGVLSRDWQHGLVKVPSPKDLKFLNELYTHGRIISSQGHSTSSATQRTPYILGDYNQGPLLEPRKAIDCINRLREQHNNLYRRLRKFFGRNDDIAIMDGICHILASLHCEHPQYRRVLDELKSQANAADFFQILVGSSSYLDFNGLLDELIHQYGDHELKKDADSYRKDLLTFLGHTTVKQAANPQQPWWPARYDNIPPKFTKVKTQVLKDPDTFRLIDLISCRMRFTSEIGLHHLIFIIIGVEELNSFGVSWLVPSILVPVLEDAVKSSNVVSIFQTYEITSLSIMTERILYTEELGVESSFLKGTSSPAASSQISKLVPQLEVLRLESRSVKHHRFVQDPMIAKEVTDMPGIGKTLGERLIAAGFAKAETVLGQFLTLEKDEKKFKHWLKESCGADSRRQHECYRAVKEWCEQHI